MNKLLIVTAAIFSGAAALLATRGHTFTRVDAGGPRLRMLICGQAEPSRPTVIFEAGAGGPLEAWGKVQSGVSEFAQTVSYDRAGNGLSQNGPAPRDGRRIAAELHLALHNANVSPPYILVGHSLGGPYIRIFSGMYQDEVVALVLVDPTQEDLIAWAKGRSKAPEARAPRPDHEVDCAPATFAQTREFPVPTNMPIVLISGLGPSVTPGFVTKEFRQEIKKDQETNYPTKQKFHKDWVERFPHGQLIGTTNSGHGIPLEEPELVVKTIRAVVDRVSRADDASEMRR